jgi:hypothetical protein
LAHEAVAGFYARCEVIDMLPKIEVEYLESLEVSDRDSRMEWLIEEVKRLRKVATAVTAVRIAKPENYQEAVFELDDALMDAGYFSVKDKDKQALNAEVAERRVRRQRLEQQMDDINARGYGGLYADELRAAGHRPWMHGEPAADCWCQRDIVYSASATSDA